MNISRDLALKVGAGTATAMAAGTGMEIARRNGALGEYFSSSEIDGGVKGDRGGDTNLSLSSHRASEKTEDEKLKLLGIEDAGCLLGSSKSSGKCSLDEEKLKKIKFYGRGEGDLSISGGSGGVALKIEKTQEVDVFPQGIKITFENKETLVASAGSFNLNWPRGTNPEYKIKEEGDNLSIERAWNLESFAKKRGKFKDCESEECTFEIDTEINLLVSGSEKIGLRIKGDDGKKMKVEEGVGGYNQGLKFTVPGSEYITLEGNGGKEYLYGTGFSKFYEVKEMESGANKGKWFFIERF